MISQLIYHASTHIPHDIPTSAQAWLLAKRIKAKIQKPTLWVVENNQIASQLIQELHDHLGDHPGILHLPDWETLPYDRFQPHPHITSDRLSAFYRMQHEPMQLLITSSSTLLYKQVNPQWIKNNLWHSTAESIQSRQSWHTKLSQVYDRVPSLVEEGQYSTRGSIIDIYPIGHMPCRLDFLDDTLESITLLSKDDFTPLRALSSINLMPRFEAKEAACDTSWINDLTNKDPQLIKRLKHAAIVPGYHYYLPSYHNDLCSLLDHMPEDTELLIHQNAQAAMNDHWQLLNNRFKLQQTQAVFPPSSIAYTPEYFKEKMIPNTKPSSVVEALFPIPDLELLLTKRSMICSKNPARQILLHDYFIRKKISVIIHSTLPEIEEIIPGIHLVVLPLTESYSIPSWQLYWISEESFTASQRSYTQKVKVDRKPSTELPSNPWESFSVGQKVTHHDYGIGLLIDLVHLKEHAQVEAFVKIQYANNKMVYLPIDGLEKLSPFHGEADLNDPGHSKWRNRVQRAKEACELYASSMLNADVLRQTSTAPIIKRQDSYDLFCSQFYYDPTEDQLRASSEIIHDLSQSKPMDRLLLGDVGFGKTEVILRTAFISIMSGHKVIVLCPTTILAQQHYQSALERMSQWPIQIGLMSRLKKLSERKQTFEDFQSGKLDIIFATQAILSYHISSKKLGLIVIDEEHRFGVKDKQTLLDLHPSVHRLSVSATPIPRTLQSALQSLKKMSFLQNPPKLRLPVQTHVSPYDETIIEEAITREITRGGQVFFIHNDIESQESIKSYLRSKYPHLSVACIYGQMEENQLTDIMQHFLSGQHQILISTTLIESGIDIPNANTIIINRADKLGLAQLHQLRGRVGRSNHQGYAYLFYPSQLSDGHAKQRLLALQEHSGLGSGWLLSIKDLEIRGAGSILGEAQSGHMDHIGYGLYQSLLNEAIAKYNPESQLTSRMCAIDLKVERYIPESYVYNINDRMNLYRSVSEVRSIAELDALEIKLRYDHGIPPQVVLSILNHQRLCLITSGSPLESIIKYNDRLVWSWHDHSSIDSNILFEWASGKEFDIKFTSNFSFSIRSDDDPYIQCIDIYAILNKKTA